MQHKIVFENIKKEKSQNMQEKQLFCNDYK